MKKLLTMITGSIIALTAHAQTGRQLNTGSQSPAVHHGAVSHLNTAPAIPAPRPVAGTAKGLTATAFVTEPFSATSLTTGGWTTGGNTGADSWTYTTSATNTGYLPDLYSTTASTGWLQYDAYTIALAHGNVRPQIGYLTSPSYSCAGHSYVGVRFQEYAERLADTFYVRVSTDNFATSTQYYVYPNDALGQNVETDNPTIVNINISATAANQANVKIRFEYFGNYSGGGTNGSGGTYGWAIDDFQLVDLDQVDLAVGKSAVVMPLHTANGFTTFTSIPLQFVDSLYPTTNLYNYGGTAQTNATVTATIYTGSASVPSSKTFTNIPVNSSDIPVYYTPPTQTDPTIFTGIGAAKPTSTGNVITAFNVNQASDGTASNNSDTVFQAVTDSVWTNYDATSANGGFTTTGGYYLQRRASGTKSAVAFYTGMLFEVGAGKSDTLTSVDIPFYPGGSAGTNVRVEIYKEDENTAGTYNQFGSTETRTLTAGNFSTTGNLVWTKFMSNVGTSALKNYTIMSQGEYAVVVTGLNFKSTDEVLVYYTNGPAPIVGKFGFSDTSNGAGFTFGTDNLTQNQSVPLMRLNFSNNARKILVGVNDVQAAAYDLNAFPNPAGKDLAISFKLPKSQAATVRLMNTMGQVVMTQSLEHVTAGQATTTHFNTAALAAGMYYYSVEADGQRAAGRVVVAH